MDGEHVFEVWLRLDKLALTSAGSFSNQPPESRNSKHRDDVQKLLLLLILSMN